jgi:glycogen operon protein
VRRRGGVATDTSAAAAGKGKLLKILVGHPYPLGATFDGAGTNFSLFSEVAQKVVLCLFEADGSEKQIPLPETTAYCWHGYLPGVQPGQRYGYRVHGPWAPQEGKLCCPAKLLLDPYAKAIDGQPTWGPSLYPGTSANGLGPPDERDSASSMPKSVVINPFFDFSRDRRPSRTLHETIIYETHIRGLTQLHPDIPQELRGTYAGLGHPAMIDYLLRLGITAVELLPVHHFIRDQRLLERGLGNYWGYNSIGYFAPHSDYSSAGAAGQQVHEFKSMVLNLHQAGIEVILDVVYNHTAEGNHLGPMLSFKGIDNAAYYRLRHDAPQFYVDYTGTGNSLNVRHPQVLQLIMDSLRYWVLEMHVDGFRFDLAAALARELHDVDRLSSFFDIIHQDPVISQVKLIAEPWDVGDGGYQVGNFPPLWSEWNGLYRDGIRDFWRGSESSLRQFAHRFTGSGDLYANTGRRPYGSVNFVTAHDGFTLADLVSYSAKHNEANGDDNRDGADDNRSWNCGVEGPTDDPAVIELRRRQQRNFLTTLLTSQGIPMILGGDEFGRTQHGNNNAYCQDNEISWYDWQHADEQLLEFTRSLIALRHEHPVFRRWKWFQGRPLWGDDMKDIAWFRPDGEPMTDDDWRQGFAKGLQVFLSGALNAMDPRGEAVVDDDFVVLLNASDNGVEFRLPLTSHQPWQLVLDTAEALVLDEQPILPQPSRVLGPRSMAILRRVCDPSCRSERSRQATAGLDGRDGG